MISFRPRVSGLSILLLLSILFLNMPSPAGRAHYDSNRVMQPPVPFKERILSTNQSLEKLSGDLQQLLSSAPISSKAQAYDQETGEPLLVTALVEPGADVQRFFKRSVRSRQVAGFEWVTGEIDLYNLRKLAGDHQVVGVVSKNTFRTAEAPGLDDLRTGPNRISISQLRSALAQGGPAKLLEQANVLKQERLTAQDLNSSAQPVVIPGAANTLTQDLLDIHDVREARGQGYSGQGVLVGVVDTGVDFSHPDLQGTQAVINNDGPYSGWPFAYDTVSGLRYALDATSTVGPDNYWAQAGLTGYVHTLPVENATCISATCSGKLVLVGDEETGVTAQFTWPNTSRSHHYYYSVHPDFYLALYAYYMGINYPEGWLLPPVVVVSDEVQAGKYDTVYVDVNFNHTLTDPNERMTRSNPVAGAVLTNGANQDKVWDLSAGMLAWISDGINQPPGVTVLYPDAVTGRPPGTGELLVFILDQDGHGTSCASVIAGQSRITDPLGQGPSNPLFAGGQAVGGAGGAVIPAMAPGAKLAAFQNGYYYPFDAWVLATLGMDGDGATNDGVNIISNSWGDSQVIPDGWDVTSRFAQQLSYTEANSVSFLVATGNGGHGYGTQTAPGGGSIIDVGASTAYGSLRGFEHVGPDQFLYGDVQPWSNRGPGMLGDIAPDIVAVGAWGTAAVPLNTSWGEGQRAYDIFGGTSMSTPVAAGGMAVIYQVFRAQYDRWPTWQEARDILLSSASSLGYDVNTQGSGNMQVGRAVAMIQGQLPSVAPSQWQAGRFGSEKYPAFPAILHAGEQDTQVFTVKNGSPEPVTVNLADSMLQSYHEETFTFSYATVDTEESNSLPIFLKDITSWVDQSQLEFTPDLMRAQVVMPYSNFDVEQDFYADSWWEVYLFDWADLNEDGNLWTDTNRDGRVDKNEIDIDPETGVSEYNRFTYGYPQANYLEASLGRRSLDRRHDGVFLGLGCNFCGESTTLQVRITFYRKVDWNWLSLSNASLPIAGESAGEFTATLSVPAGTLPGAYEGMIDMNAAGGETILPVIVHVAADSATFRFGGPENPGTPYDNARMFGGFNWNWRYESGDWRMFFADIPGGTATEGKAMVVDTRWNAPMTDIDTWLLGPSQASYARQHPELFGPYQLDLTSGSENWYYRDGKFGWETSTGTSRELVAAPVQDGLNIIALHNILNNGLQFAEQYNGQAYQVTSEPGQVIFTSDPDNSTPPHLSGTQQVTFTSTGDIDEGIQIQPFGMSPPIELTDQAIQQGSPSDPCSATWIYQEGEGGLVIKNGGLLEITTSSAEGGLDLDLYLYKDNGDDKWNCNKDTLKTYSMNDAADEQIKIYFPEDGRYWVLAHGNQVPGDPAYFNMRIRSISGADLTLEHIPTAPIRANQPVTFTVNYQGKYPFTTPAKLEGLLLIGTPTVPSLLEVPVRAQPTVLLIPAPGLSADSRWVARTPVTFHLVVQNLGIQSETVRSLVQLPEELVYEPGSASGPGEISYDAAKHILSWEGQLGGAETGALAFRATARPGDPPKHVEVLAQVQGITSGQQWTTKTTVWINQYGALFPVIGR